MTIDNHSGTRLSSATDHSILFHLACCFVDGFDGNDVNPFQFYSNFFIVRVMGRWFYPPCYTRSSVSTHLLNERQSVVFKVQFIVEM